MANALRKALSGLLEREFDNADYTVIKTELGSQLGKTETDRLESVQEFCLWLMDNNGRLITQMLQAKDAELGSWLGTNIRRFASEREARDVIMTKAGGIPRGKLRRAIDAVLNDSSRFVVEGTTVRRKAAPAEPDVLLDLERVQEVRWPASIWHQTTGDFDHSALSDALAAALAWGSSTRAGLIGRVLERYSPAASVPGGDQPSVEDQVRRALDGDRLAEAIISQLSEAEILLLGEHLAKGGGPGRPAKRILEIQAKIKKAKESAPQFSPITEGRAAEALDAKLRARQPKK